MLHEIAVVVTVSEADDVSRLAPGLAVLRASCDLGPAEVVIAAKETITDDVSRTVPDVRVVPIPSDRQKRDSVDWTTICQGIQAPVIIAVPLSDLPELTTTLPVMLEGAPTGRPSDPVLVAAPGVPKWLIAAYVHHVAHDRTGDDAVLTHTGHLALRAARLSTEAIDPDSGSIRVMVRLRMPGGLAEEPPWRFRVGIRSQGKIVATSAAARLQPRTDWDGRVLFDRLVASLPLDGVPTGSYQFIIDEAVASTYPLRPSVGAVAGAGMVMTTWRDSRGKSRSLRYLPFTTGRGRVLSLRVQQGSGIRSALEWRAHRLRQDLGFIARGRAGRQVRLLLLVRLITLPFFAGRGIWLVGERHDAAQDNGLHLFRHLRNTEPLRRVYYVIDKANPQYRKIQRLGQVVPHSSWRHQLLMLHAQVLANAFATSYFIPHTWNRRDYNNHLTWRIGALRVFLQHGVHVSPNAVQRLTTGYHLFVTSAARETRALREVSGYDDQFIETGLPRYDALARTPASRMIFFMTTWRRYLPSRVFADRVVPTDAYEGSAYERFTASLLRSPRLHAMLEAHDYRLVFMPHYNLSDQFQDAVTAGDRIRVAEACTNIIQRLVRTCDVFVTDHSSVHFDAAYIGTPVIYARFDRAEYESRHAAASWFDFERDGFGPVTETLEETLDELEAVLRRDRTPAVRFAEHVKEIFTHHDQENCARVVAEIDAALAPSHRALPFSEK